jgi:hypothetical protein
MPGQNSRLHRPQRIFMGILDTLRHVFGRHGVTVRFKSIERQPPDRAEMPIHDTVVKAQLLIHAEREATIESVSIRWVARRLAADGGVREEIELAMDEIPNRMSPPGRA